MNKNKIKEFGYKLGYIFGEVCMTCMMVVIVAATIKLVTWIF